MYEIVFVVLFTTLMILSVCLAVINIAGVETVKAGRVTKHCPRFVFCGRNDSGKILVDDQMVNVSHMIHLSVCGNSMKDYGITDHQEIYATALSTEEEKNGIADYPVLVFKITNASFYDSQYKLRKFIGYGEVGYQPTAWGDLYDRNSERIKIEKEAFVNRCLEKASRLVASRVGGRVALSATYNEEDDCYDYSLHPISTIYAAVEYVV